MLELTVQAGDLDRHSPLVSAHVPLEALGARYHEPGPLQFEGGALALRDADHPDSAEDLVAQYDPAQQQLAFVIPGDVAAGSRRRFELDESAGGSPTIPSAGTYPVALIQKLDRVVWRTAGEAWATYNVQGGRRPYFWPVLGPAGASVVRGQGTGEHPHHTGMGLAYGGHSEGGSSNIWSDWDEPPYGPGGRMLHRGFRRIVGGPVYGELVEDLTYVNAYGDAFAEEVRTIRCWWASPQARFLDFQFDIQGCHDRGPQPFLFMVRLPGVFDIPKTGRVTNAIGRPVPAPERRDRQYRAAWVDGSGPTGDPPPPPPTAPPETLVDLPGARPQVQGPGNGPWNGLALFDHPGNDGFPGAIGKYAVVQQITQAHYPPAGAPNGPFTFRHRVYVHAGNADEAGVAAQAASYAQPCKVVVARR